MIGTPSWTTLHAPVLDLGSEDFSTPAIITDSGILAYGELRSTVMKGSTWLRRHGCQPGDRIGISLPKGGDAVRAIYSVLTAGGVFVPIDPAAPPVRVKQMMSDAKLQRLICSRDMKDSLEDHAAEGDTEFTSLDEGEFVALVSDEKPDEDPVVVDPDDLALLYYTSGTTGTPKAIMLSHRNVKSFTDWAVRTFEINRKDRLANHAPFHFDLSTLDLFAASSVRASTFLVDDKASMFPAKVAQILERETITVSYSVPTMLTMLVNHGALERRDLGSLRLVLFAGEPFPVPSLRRLMRLLPHCEFANLYGPTETNVCTYYRIPSIPPEGATSIPIGSACEHLKVILCDELGKEIPAGETGEITVIGPSVMLGYWNRPEATKKSRLEDESVSYRTGDFGVLDESGSIHFSGRRDEQVKIRGHRIELAEITGALVKHPAVAEAATLLIDPDQTQIVSFVVVDEDASSSVESFYRHCRTLLPSYSIPGKIVTVSSLPRTSTGKLDKQELLIRVARSGGLVHEGTIR